MVFVDVGVVAFDEWACGDFCAYICCMNGGFYLTGLIVSRKYFSWTYLIGTEICLTLLVRWFYFII